MHKNEILIAALKKIEKTHSETYSAQIARKALKEFEKKKVFSWVCNECNTPNFTMSVSKDDIEDGKLSCVGCGCVEFHIQTNEE